MEQQNGKTIFFHVGLPKTASTFLQRNVFPKFHNIHFIKKHDFKHRNKIIAQSDHQKILLSIELNLDAQGGLSKAQDVARQYPQTYPIIVLRKHGSWLESKYKYYLRKHGVHDIDEYFNFEQDRVLERKNMLFYPKIQLLEELYNNKPLVIFQEELKENPFAIIDLLADYMGAAYNKNDILIQTVKKSYSARQLKAVRRFNRMYQYDHSHIESKNKRFLYKKFGGLLLHSVAFFSGLLPEKATQKETLIPEKKIKEINEAYREDWENCLAYAKNQRELQFYPSTESL